MVLAVVDLDRACHPTAFARHISRLYSHSRRMLRARIYMEMKSWFSGMKDRDGNEVTNVRVGKDSTVLVEMVLPWECKFSG